MKWLHNLLKGASLTGALFVFQACYGIPQPLYDESGTAPMTFSVVSNETGEPLKGISILSKSNLEYDNEPWEVGVTGEDGQCKVNLQYIRNMRGPLVRFQDPEGKYAVRDTTLDDLREQVIKVRLYPNLQQ